MNCEHFPQNCCREPLSTAVCAAKINSCARKELSVSPFTRASRTARSQRTARTPRTAVVAMAALGALMASTVAVGTTSASASSIAAKPRIHVDSSSKYIVSFADPSLARYKGGIKGLPRTAATKGHRLNTTSTAAAKYRTYLVKRQAAALAKVGAGRVIGRYTSVFSGVAVELTASHRPKSCVRRRAFLGSSRMKSVSPIRFRPVIPRLSLV